MFAADFQIILGMAATHSVLLLLSHSTYIVPGGSPGNG